jgi:hypothetical protein
METDFVSKPDATLQMKIDQKHTLCNSSVTTVRNGMQFSGMIEDMK